MNYKSHEEIDTSANINTSTGLKVVDIMCFATPVKSIMVTVLARDVLLH